MDGPLNVLTCDRFLAVCVKPPGVLSEAGRPGSLPERDSETKDHRRLMTPTNTGTQVSSWMIANAKGRLILTLWLNADMMPV